MLRAMGWRMWRRGAPTEGRPYNSSPSDSPIKIAVMVEAFARVAAGKAKWTDELVLTKENKVSGSGILQELSDGLHFTLRDGVNLMMLGFSPAASKEMIDLMKREQEHYAIGRSLGDVPMATKYGVPDHLRSAIGIIYSKEGRSHGFHLR